MKATLIIFTVFVLAPAAGVALTYAAWAFLAWDWYWAVRQDAGLWRFMFLCCAAFVALLSAIGSGCIAAATVE